jgi:tetratricopeptide (TPR) repeat protein
VSMRHARLLLPAVVIGAAVVAAVPTVATAQASSPCAFARALADRNLRERAINEYVELLKSNPTLRCALNGLTALTVREQCAFPNALLKAGLRGRAINAYVRILRVRPGSPCATEALARLASRPKPIQPSASPACAVPDRLRASGRFAEAEAAYVKLLEGGLEDACAGRGLAAIRSRRCTLANRLDDQGDEEAAKAIYAELVKHHPTLACALEGLADLDDEDWPERAEQFTTDVGKVAGALALLGAVLVGLLFLAGRPTWVADFLHKRALVGNFFAPRIALGDFKAAGKDETADSFVASLRSGLHRLARDKRGGGPDVSGVGTYQGLGPAISSLGDASPHLKAAGAVIALMAELRPRRRFSLNGTLGPGLTEVAATLEEKGSVQEIAAIDAAKPPATGSADDLALVLAAWAHGLVRRLSRSRRSPHTDDPLSFAFLDAGLALEARGNDKGAEQLYRAALKLDARNIGAWIALGNLDCKETATVQGVEKYRWALLLAEGLE